MASKTGKTTTTTNNNNNNKNGNESTNNLRAVKKLLDVFQNDEKVHKSAPHLSHYKEIPSSVMKSYELLEQGSTMIHSTSTKYTLVGKFAIEEQVKLSTELLRGCEVIGAAVHILLQDGSGCSVAVRKSAVRAVLSILINVVRLMESFEDGTALGGNEEEKNKNLAAQKTGAVWESCDTIIKKLLPQGNRNAIRRELFTWTRECQDSMEEFQEMVDLGPAVASRNNAEKDDVDEDEEYDDYFDDDDDDEKYTELELPIAKACLNLLKCSRGTLKVTVETCEDLGLKAAETQDETFLDHILAMHEIVRPVGIGVTDLGSLMYPPILSSIKELEAQVQIQVNAIIAAQDFILSLPGLPSKVTELSSILKTAAETRHLQFTTAVKEAEANNE